MKIVELRPYSWDSRRVYIAFAGFPPCLHRIRGIPAVFTSHSWDSRRVYIAFAGFPPYLYHIRGFPPCLHHIHGILIVFTSYLWNSHRIYIVFVGFPPFSHRILRDSESREAAVSPLINVFTRGTVVYIFQLFVS
jgi:hypothetical protein